MSCGVVVVVLVSLCVSTEPAQQLSPVQSHSGAGAQSITTADIPALSSTERHYNMPERTQERFCSARSGRLAHTNVLSRGEKDEGGRKERGFVWVHLPGEANGNKKWR